MSNSTWNSSISALTNFFYPPPVPADNFVSYGASGKLPGNTDIHDICYNFPGGFEVCSTEKEMIFAWNDPKLAYLVNPEKSPLPNVAKKTWSLTGPHLWAITNLPISFTLGLPNVTRNSDKNHGHQYITSTAMTGGLEKSLRTYLGSSFSSLPERVSENDMPGIEIAQYLNLMSLLLANIGGGDQSKHALRSYFVDYNNGATAIRLESQAETQAKIRNRLDQHLTRLWEINQQLTSTNSIFTPTPFMNDLHEQLAMIDSSLKYGDYAGALDVAEALQGYFEAGQMSIFTIHNRSAFLQTPESTSRLTEPHIALEGLMNNVIAQSARAEKTQDPDDIAEVVATYRLILMYVRPEYRKDMAHGQAALLAERDNILSEMLHTAQDYLAHCNGWTNDIDGDDYGDVCTESVVVNLFGLGPGHDEHDNIEGTDGERKLARAVAISERVLSLAIITDKTEFDTEKEKFLNDYWPLDIAYSDNFQLVYNTGEKDDIYIANNAEGTSPVGTQ